VRQRSLSPKKSPSTNPNTVALAPVSAVMVVSSIYASQLIDGHAQPNHFSVC
jgi:hypothetical protein